jgi:AAA ATPase domain
MDQVSNPYSPGAGQRPVELAGRADAVGDMDVALRRILLGRSAQSQLITGLRGVGKTVLLQEFARLAAKRGFIHEHLEATTEGDQLPLQVTLALRKALFKLGGKKKAKGVNRRALGVLKSFALTRPNGESLLNDVEAVPGVADSGDLGTDLAALFEEVGRAAAAHDTGIFLTIDELHRLPHAALEALLVGLYGVSQLGLPLVLAGAGLPTLAAVSGEVSAYAERIFRIKPIGPLSAEETSAAVVLPAAAEGVTWKGAAVSRLYEVTQGYPYFVQEFARQAWDVADDGSDVIRLTDVERSIPLATTELDQAFFGLRTAKTTDPERAYLRAMAELGPGVVRSTDVATLLGKKTAQVAPVRDTLMKKAICFSPRFNELAFTVPMFDQFMRRWIPSPAPSPIPA